MRGTEEDRGQSEAIGGREYQKAEEMPRPAATETRRRSVSQGDTFRLAGRFPEAHSLYTQAYDQFAELKRPSPLPKSVSGVHTIKRRFRS